MTEQPEHLEQNADTNDEKYLTTARKRFQLCVDAENEIRIRALEDLRFYEGEGQWDEMIRRQRELEGRPCLTFNRLPESVHQVTNEFRQNKPAPMVKPVDDRGDIKTAEAYQGLYRHIERQSRADAVRSYAATYSTICGRGWYRLAIDWADDETFDQEIYIRRIKSQSSVYMDPSAQEPDYSDAKYGFIAHDPLKDDFKAEYPESKYAAGLCDFTSIGDGEGWLTGETIRVVEYFHIEYETRDLTAELPGGGVRSRKVRRPIVHSCIMTGTEVLDKKVWPGRWIPLIPVLGEELEIDGKTKLRGMVRNAMDAQKQYNYMRTAQTETIALAPKAPYIAAEGQIEGHEEMWANSNNKPYPVLFYKPVKSAQGDYVPPPARQNYEPPIAAMTQAVMLAGEDIKSTLGIQDAARGARSNETSGIAIAQKQRESDTANYHFMDGVNIAVNHEARMIIELIPIIYDRPGRVIRILGEDGKETRGMIAGGDEPGMLPAEIKGLYDLQSGKYDVSVNMGQSYATRRQEAAASLIELAKADPGLMATAPDLVYKTLDIPGSQEIAERRKKALPPGLADDDENDPKAQLAAAQQQLAQYGPVVDELTKQVETMSDEIRTKRFELDSKERIEFARLELAKEELQLKAATELAKLGSAEALAQMQAELTQLREGYQLLHASAEAGAARDHQQQQAEADRAHQAGEADASRAHQSGEAELARQAQAEQQAAAAAGGTQA